MANQVLLCEIVQVSTRYHVVELIRDCGILARRCLLRHLVQVKGAIEMPDSFSFLSFVVFNSKFAEPLICKWANLKVW